MRKAILVVVCVLAMAPPAAFAQEESQAGVGSGAGSGQSGSKSSSTQSRTTVTTTSDGSTTQSRTAVTTKTDAAPQVKFVRTLTNVQVELMLSDHIGSQPPEKKTVSMIVASGSWGKVRSAGMVGMPPAVVDLNVDARPFVSMEGLIQLELTLVYSPPGSADKDLSKPRPTGVNQSLTVVLQSGKPLIVSQAADPISDRKVIVEVKATILK